MATAVRFLPIVRYVPVLRSQIRGVETLADAGLVLSQAGISVSDAAAVIIDAPESSSSLSDALDEMRTIRGLLSTGLQSIDVAAEKVDGIGGAFLPGPVGSARGDFRRRLPEIRERAAESEKALAAMITFVGGSGPRRYLFLSQNPDEIRPNGGYIGTYGVLTAEGGKLALDRYDSTQSWTKNRPEAEVAPEERGAPFKYDTRAPQLISNVNTVPDWPTTARLAARLWRQGGEEPVDGVFTFTPSFMARLLTVVGPVDLEGYGERITADNMIDRLNFYTHDQRLVLGSDRKDIIAVLAQEVLERLIDVPASKWSVLGKAMATSFQEREAMAWSADTDVESVLAERRWDGAVPEVTGDFVCPAEFQYAAKNARSLRRSYQHHVVLRPDGSGTVTTTVRIRNPNPADDFANKSGVPAYITMYGPAGATIADGTDRFGLVEPAVAGHPAHGWFRPIEPESETTVTVVWDVPRLATERADGGWEYSLLWMRHPDHTGDTLELTFELPTGWSWAGDPPPNQVGLDKDVTGTWPLRT